MRRSLSLQFKRCWSALLAAAAGIVVCCLGSPSWARLADPAAGWPPLQSHPLPPSLIAVDRPEAGDYFEQVEATPAGYLIWSSLPVKVYLEPAAGAPAWEAAIRQAMREWGTLLPLVEVTSPAAADILWRRQPPPFRVRLDRQRRELVFPSARRTAEASLEFYWQPGPPPRLAHRCTILLAPGQTARQTLGTARHELGHALGIWGHSPDPGDVLYAEQVREPPPISPRDRNTLRKVYEQPTRLGWPVPGT